MSCHSMRWSDIEGAIEPDEVPFSVTCMECRHFHPCPDCDCGVCHKHTLWKDSDLFWSHANESCEDWSE